METQLLEQLEHYEQQVEFNECDRTSVLYDSAVDFIRLASMRLGAGDMDEARFYINKAEAAVSELYGSLDTKDNEVARNIKRLYEYVLERLGHACVYNDLMALDKAVRVLDELRDAWK